MNFPLFLSILNFIFIPLWLEKIFYMISVFLGFWRLVLWLGIWSILWNILLICILQKNGNFAALAIKCAFKFSVSFLLFCLDDLHSGDSCVLIFLTIILFLHISPSRVLTFSLYNMFSGSNADYIHIYNCHNFLMN